MTEQSIHTPTIQSTEPSRAQQYFPWVVLMVVVVYTLGALMRGPAPATSGFDYAAFGRIPASAEGRTKPLDTVARNTLMQVSGKQTLKDVQTFIPGSTQVEAIEWLAWVMTHPEVASEIPIFRVDHPEVLATIGMSDSGRKRFSLTEVLTNFEELNAQVGRAFDILPKQRPPYERHLLELYSRVSSYMRLGRFESPYLVPPIVENEDWMPLRQGFEQMPDHPGVDSLREIMFAHQSGNVTAFNAAVSDHLVLVEHADQRAADRANIEVQFNRAKPFLNAAVLYVFAFLLACAGVLMSCTQKQQWARSIGRATLGILVVAFIVQTLGLGTRMYLQGRPPVTNLYSSAVFVGYVGVLLGIIIERLFRIGLGSLVASAIGFTTLIIAHNLGASGDTMQMMQAVLDTNIWLATHVVVITIGYSATFLAGLLAIIYILMGVLTPALNKDRAKAISKMIYGTICFAALMSFVGTVLGGIWADQSWGRFWGWDPKENGAVLIVMMNLLILHARWGGMIKQRGIAVLAVGGNIITAWAWFGTNMLGVGLHSYGFTDSAAFWMIVFVCSQLLVMAVGLVPMRMWLSSPNRTSSNRSAPSSAKIAAS